MKKFNTLSGMPEITFANDKFVASNAGEDEDLKKFDQFDKSTYPSDPKVRNKLLTDKAKQGKLFELGKSQFGEPVTWNYKVDEYNKLKDIAKKYTKPVNNFGDIASNLDAMSNQQKLDAYFKSASPREKIQMRKDFKEYDFTKKMFVEDIPKPKEEPKPIEPKQEPKPKEPEEDLETMIVRKARESFLKDQEEFRRLNGDTGMAKIYGQQQYGYFEDE
tara:strand:+ start:450 stop:1103 length:654 start_codon:yes stop_codon:yes gene_type:complete